MFHFLRLVEELKPRIFVMENVPGMVTGPHNDLLFELIKRFGELGYKVRMPYKILNAANFGVPQDRRRLFLIGARSTTTLPEYPAPVTMLRTNGHTSNGNGFLKLELPYCPTAKDALQDLPDIELYDSLFETDELKIRLSGGSQYAKILRGQIEDPNDYSHPREHDRSLLTGCLRAQHTPFSRRRFKNTPPENTLSLSAGSFELPKVESAIRSALARPLIEVLLARPDQYIPFTLAASLFGRLLDFTHTPTGFGFTGPFGTVLDK